MAIVLVAGERRLSGVRVDARPHAPAHIPNGRDRQVIACHGASVEGGGLATLARDPLRQAAQTLDLAEGVQALGS